jgi:hypothetical protein
MTPLAGTVVTCTPSQTVDTLMHCIKVGQPVFLAGDPGIGKSEVTYQVARRIYGTSTDTRTQADTYFRDVRAVLYDAVDVRGLPYVKDGVTYWSVSSLWPQEGSGLILHDEINRAPPSVQNALFQLVLDRRLAEYRLPDGWQQVAAGNPSDVGVNKMSAALKSRFLRINMVTDTADWLKWAASHGIVAVVLAYLRDHADQLHRYDPKADAFPSPRTWSFVSRIIDPALPQHVERAMIAGSIGETYLPGFWAYLDMFRKLANQFDLAALRAAPDTYQIPTSPSLAYAVANGLALTTDHANIAATFTYLARMPAEYGIFAAKAALRRDPTIEQTRAYTQWYASHADSY